MYCSTCRRYRGDGALVSLETRLTAFAAHPRYYPTRIIGCALEPRPLSQQHHSRSRRRRKRSAGSNDIPHIWPPWPPPQTKTVSATSPYTRLAHLLHTRTTGCARARNVAPETLFHGLEGYSAHELHFFSSEYGRSVTGLLYNSCALFLRLIITGSTPQAAL